MAEALLDQSSTVSSVSFQDLDVKSRQMGGAVVWTRSIGFGVWHIMKILGNTETIMYLSKVSNRGFIGAPVAAPHWGGIPLIEDKK